jgi:hypothetical protein
VRPRGHAGAERAAERAALVPELAPLDGGAGALGVRARVLEVGAGEQDEELLAAVPPHPVDLAGRVAEDVGDLPQHGVAGLVAVRVVDALEVVDVGHDDGERLVEARGVLERLGEPLLDVPPVVDAGEPVGLRHAPQLVVGPRQLLLQRLDAQQRLHARLELGELDRLGDVVVGAGVEPLDHVLGAVERGLQHDRHERQPGLALMRRATSMPSSCGIIQSSSTRSGGSANTRSSACSPSLAASTR